MLRRLVLARLNHQGGYYFSTSHQPSGLDSPDMLAIKLLGLNAWFVFPKDCPSRDCVQFVFTIKVPFFCSI